MLFFGALNAVDSIFWTPEFKTIISGNPYVPLNAFDLILLILLLFIIIPPFANAFWLGKLICFKSAPSKALSPIVSILFPIFKITSSCCFPENALSYMVVTLKVFPLIIGSLG